MWNGIVINSTDFSRTAEWSKESPNENITIPPENIPGPVRTAPYQDSTDSSIKFPDPALEQENIFPRILEVKFLRLEISPDVDIFSLTGGFIVPN